MNGLVDDWEETDVTGPTSETKVKEEMKERVSQIVAKKVYKDLTK